MPTIKFRERNGFPAIAHSKDMVRNCKEMVRNCKESIRGRQQAMGGGVRELDKGPKIYDLQKEFVLEKSQSQLAIFVAC